VSSDASVAVSLDAETFFLAALLEGHSALAANDAVRLPDVSPAQTPDPRSFARPRTHLHNTTPATH
jgi:hypothetical protein